MSYLGKHAEYYDLFYKDKPYPEEAKYVSDLIKLQSPDAQSILDLGCGTGLRSLEFARLGYRVSGVDQSLPMLAAARQHLSLATDVPPGSVEFLAGDITTFRSIRAYDAIISLFHVFSYLTTPQSLREAVVCSFNNLTPGGVFLFDYWHGPGVLNDPPAPRTRRVEESDTTVERTSIPTHFPDKNLVALSLSLDITENKTDFSQHAEESYLLRYWFPDELERQLHNSGFRDISHYAWLKQFSPRRESWQACIVAIKPMSLPRRYKLGS